MNEKDGYRLNLANPANIVSAGKTKIRDSSHFIRPQFPKCEFEESSGMELDVTLQKPDFSNRSAG